MADKYGTNTPKMKLFSFEHDLAVFPGLIVRAEGLYLNLCLDGSGLIQFIGDVLEPFDHCVPAEAVSDQVRLIDLYSLFKLSLAKVLHTNQMVKRQNAT